jgi:hypothetical protein
VLNENDNPNRDNAWLAAEAAAAMRDLAGTITDAPPLRLTAEFSPARPRRHPRAARRWRSWFAPLLAAAAVAAIAVTLVIVRDMPNGRVAPSVTPVPAPATVDGVPTYYVALGPAAKTAGAPNGLIVGDTASGKTVATVPPPADSTIVSVSGASDDRTFAVAAAPASGGSGGSNSSTAANAFYLLTIAPGGAKPARLTALPIGPLSGVIATALSADGTELAIATAGAATDGAPAVRRLALYSVAAGRLLHSWTTTDPAAIVSDAMPAGLRQGPQYPALSWINGDRAIAFPTLSKTGLLYSLQVRSVNVTAPGTDLIADSKSLVNLGQATSTAELCGTVFPLLSGNGTTLFCPLSLGANGHTSPTTVRWWLKWMPMATELADNAQWRFVSYLKELGVPAGSTVYPATVWSGSTGSTVLIEWSVVAQGQPATRPESVRFGVLRIGNNATKFTPLPAPAIFATGGLATSVLPGIAW